MKRLPIILLFVGVLVIGGIFLLIKGRNAGTSVDDEETVAEIPLDQRPVVSLIPFTDEHGQWVKLTITDIKLKTASLDYLMTYKVEGDTGEQGVPGTIKLNGLTNIERKFYLGSESSGKFRQDKWIGPGELSLKFRDTNGKLVGKLLDDFIIYRPGQTSLKSADGKFAFTLDKSSETAYAIVMTSFGLPANAPGTPSVGPYGVFSSESGLTGSAKPATNFWNGTSWAGVSGSTTPGIFISISQ